MIEASPSVRKTMSNPIKPNVILMSATITPSKDMPGSTRMDPAIRMNDYIEALRYYEGVAPEVVDRIVFLENSDTDLTPLKNALQRKSYKNVEFISVSSDYPPSRGKGYGEFRMFDEGLLASESIKADDHIWKVTGRLKILNIKQLICSAPADYEVYCDLRDVPLIGESLGGNLWMELRTFAFRRDAYDRYFRGEFSKSFVLEKKFFQTMKEELKKRNKQIIPRFRVQPIIDGYSGYSNANYRSASYRAKEKLRMVARTIAPGLWL
ncbi:hypothetical protein HD842_001094 [Massilia aurea]|uniref:Glycosyltransferase 2-like domain-containing protein n=1 Tax=Massilia aurea TaxID=373040 RepID=A0A7W9WY61_9BURK|nr:hypothetical protein [Massilia aurea]MBB6132983.1 hypothetical protein [Massilia aurea]